MATTIAATAKAAATVAGRSMPGAAGVDRIRPASVHSFPFDFAFHVALSITSPARAMLQLVDAAQDLGCGIPGTATSASRSTK